MEKFDNLSDRELVEKLSFEDHSVLKEVYKRGKFEIVKNWITKNGGSEADAKDVFQESIMVIYQKALGGNFELTSALSTYVFGVSRNKWMKSLNKSKHLVAKDIKEYEEFIPDSNVGLESKQILEERIGLVEDILKEMGDPCKTLIIRFYYYKQSMQQIKEEMGYKEINVVKQAKFKCIQRIKKKIA